MSTSSSAAPLAQPASLRVWILAARPATLTASIVPVLVGSAVAASQGAFNPVVFAFALVASMLIQVGTNIANDYFDFLKGADTEDRLGPMRVTQSGLLAPEKVRLGMLVAFGLAVLAGIYPVVVGGWTILAIGLLCIAAGVLYTGGPWPFAYHGLGDLFVFIFFGPVAVMGTAYLYMHTFTTTSFLASLPEGALITAILVVNNLRDIDTDRRVGKYTLAVYVGRLATRVEYLVMLVGAYLVPLGLWLSGRASPWMLLTLLSVPLAVRLVRAVWTQEGRPLSLAMKGTGQFLLAFGVLFSLGTLLH